MLRKKKEALAVLRGTQVLKSHSAQIFRQPKHSRIALLNSKSRLVVEIPPVWLQIHRYRIFPVSYPGLQGNFIAVARDSASIDHLLFIRTTCSAIWLQRTFFCSLSS